MGSSLTICTKLLSQPETTNPYVSISNLEEEEILEKTNEILSNLNSIDLEKELGPFQFTHNYFFASENGIISKVLLDFNSIDFTRQHTSVSSLIGQDADGLWVYTGECLSNSIIKDGRGLLIHLNKEFKFQGYFHNDLWNGKGRLAYNDKVQEGDWFNDDIIGEGKEVLKDRSLYIGKFSNCLYENLGKLTFPDRSSYIGEFFKGERQGYGEYQWTDGSKYIGNWKSNKFQGLGKYIDFEGNIYEGGWKENHMDGYGEFTWKDGRNYRGNYYSGKKHGYGEMLWPDGNSWRGSWKNGKQHGKGEYVINGVKQVGFWYEGKFISWKEG